MAQSQVGGRRGEGRILEDRFEPVQSCGAADLAQRRSQECRGPFGVFGGFEVGGAGHSLAELAALINPVIRGWQQYYGAFYRSALYGLFSRINAYLLRWIRRKYKRLRAFTKAKASWRRVTIASPPCSLTGPGAAQPGDQDDKSRMSREAHVRILWEPGGAIPPGYPASSTTPKPRTNSSIYYQASRPQPHHDTPANPLVKAQNYSPDTTAMSGVLISRAQRRRQLFAFHAHLQTAYSNAPSQHRYRGVSSFARIRRRARRSAPAPPI